MFKKSRIRISYWYLATVAAMAICYLVFSRKDFPWMIVTTFGYLLIGILLLAVPALLIGSVVVTVYVLRRRKRSRQKKTSPRPEKGG